MNLLVFDTVTLVGVLVSESRVGLRDIWRRCCSQGRSLDVWRPDSRGATMWRMTCPLWLVGFIVFISEQT